MFKISLNLPIIVVTLQWNTELISIKISISGDSIGTICQNQMNGMIRSTFRSILFRSNLDPEIGMDTWNLVETNPLSVPISGSIQYRSELVELQYKEMCILNYKVINIITTTQNFLGCIYLTSKLFFSKNIITISFYHLNRSSFHLTYISTL